VNFDQLLKLYRSGDTLRYHTAPRLNDQTVSAHAWGVLAIVLHLEPDPSLALIKAALFHDAAESVTGDLPATFKWAAPEIASLIEKAEARILMDMGVEYDLTEKEAAVLKVADLGELVLHCTKEVMMGNLYASAIVVRGLDALEPYYLEGGAKFTAFIDELNQYHRDMKDNL
jgi:5'-deoxynucleotidase YfbR-like HD superfamily hydrolase